MLRTEDCTQGTPRCRGRTDKLCVEEMLGGEVLLIECHGTTDELCLGEILWGIVEGRLLRLGIRLSTRLHY